MTRKRLYGVGVWLMFASAAQSGWATPDLPSWVGAATHTWKPRLGGVYWLDSRAVVRQAAPYLTQSARPALVDIKSDATGFGYRFDLNSWDARSAIHSYYSWDGTDAGTPASPEDALSILGATGNAEFILNIPIPLNLTATPSSNWGYDGYGYTWQTAQFYAAMVQYLVGTAGPQSEWQNLPTALDFFTQPASFNWADLRARRGHVNPYAVVAFIIGQEPYTIEGTPTGALYGPQAEKFRVAIRARGFTGALGLHVHDGGHVDDPGGMWFWPMMNSVTASDFSFLDLEHYYQFTSVAEDFKRTFPITIDTNAAYWLPRSQWKSDYTKFLWVVEDTRHAIRDDNTVAGLGEPSRWNLGFSEHGIQITSQFVYNDMFSAMHWAGWLAEAMRQNVAWDSGWTLLGEGYAHAQLQVRNGYVTRTPMFFVYQMAQEFYGLDYLTNGYASPLGSTIALGGDSVQYPWTTLRVLRDPASGNIHLFVLNQSTTGTATVAGFENWNVLSWKQLAGTSYSANNPLGVPGPEPIQTRAVALPAPGSPLSIPPISVNHIVLSGGTNVVTPPLSVARVAVAATVPTAVIGTASHGVLTFTRSGGTSQPLTVNFSLGGTAVKWDDYRRPVLGDMPASVTIPAGASACSMSIAAIGNETGADPEYFTVTLSADPAYLLGSPRSATVTLAVASVPSALARTSDNRSVIHWASVAGKTYRVECEDSLGGAAWTDLSGPITATGAATSYTDTTAGGRTQRYYTVYLTN